MAAWKDESACAPAAGWWSKTSTTAATSSIRRRKPSTDITRSIAKWFAPRGCDPNIGPRLPILLRRAGFLDIGVNVAQPLGIDGEIKLINPVTMENLAPALLTLGLTTANEVDRIVRALYDLAADPETVAGMPRVVQSWGRKPA